MELRWTNLSKGRKFQSDSYNTMTALHLISKSEIKREREREAHTHRERIKVKER